MSNLPKPNAQDWTIKEQIIHDLVSGLSFQFELGGKHPIMRFTGESLPFGNREFIFGDDGLLGGTGTFTQYSPSLTWITEVK